MILSVRKPKVKRFHAQLRKQGVPFKMVTGPFADERSVRIADHWHSKALAIWMALVARR